MPVSNRPWGSISESDYPSPESFCRASLIDLNPAGQRKTKANCKLPVREPGGALNRNGVHAAAQRLMATDAPPEEKRAAARKLIRLYAEIGDEPPESVRRMARG
jgi:hypothetical protein